MDDNFFFIFIKIKYKLNRLYPNANSSYYNFIFFEMKVKNINHDEDCIMQEMRELVNIDL